MSLITTFAQEKLKLPGVFNSVSMAGLQRLYKGLLSVAHEKKIAVASRPLPQPQQCPECKNELGAANVVYSRIAVCDHCGYHFVWSAHKRVEHLADPGTFRLIGHAIQPVDFLGFVDEQSYTQKLIASQEMRVRDMV
jgi:acetyl-CoA carboxylase beta subunit